MKKQLMMVCVCLVSMAASAAVVVDFEEISLSSESYFPTMTSGSSGVVSNGVYLPYLVTDWGYGFMSWDGFVVSNMTDTTTPGFGNQYSAITGGGVNGSDNYVVAYPGYSTYYITLPTNSIVQGAYFTNTTYAALDMQNGSAFSKQFEDGDFFKVIVKGLDSSNQSTGTIEVSLANGTNILNQWLWVDLSGLGLVSKLQFSFASSDVGAWGINTPTYFAMDNLTYESVVLPEPATLLMLGAGFAAMLRKRNRA